MNKIVLIMILGLLGVNIPNPVDHVETEEEVAITRGLSWLAAAQHQDGSWGAGSHARQDVRDPNAVAGDPATTAFAALALVRAGSTTSSGSYQPQVQKAVDYLVRTVHTSNLNDPQITDQRGTQPQVKLGVNIDVALTAQFLSRVLNDDLSPSMELKVKQALQICVDKLQLSQQGDGNWKQGGWAAALQSAAAFNALESARTQGLDLDEDAFKRAKEFQQDRVSATGSGAPSVRTDDAAGIALYSLAGNQRATARDAKKAKDWEERARREGKLKAGEELSEVVLQEYAPAEEAEQVMNAYRKNKATQKQLQSEQVLAGFGNNGGEEFLSYMMTSESLIITGGAAWTKWDQSMKQRLAKIQNNNGSWSGHHCITSPVFCTAAALLTMTTERDREVLVKAVE